MRQRCALGLMAMLMAIAAQLRAVVGTCATVGGQCICTTASGVAWDLTSIQSNSITTTGDVLPGCTLCTGQWTYTFAICGNAVQQTGVGCLSTQNRNAYRVDQSTSPRCEYMGQDALTGVPLVVTDLADGNGISIAYTDTVRTMTLNIRCETPYGTAPAPLGPGSGSNNIVLNWANAVVCTAGGGNGWLIVILMGVAAGVYVGGGIGYVKRQSPDAPIALETHPHIHLWREVPGLVADGIYFTRVKLSSNVEFLAFLAPKDAPLSKSYTEIDEGSAGGSGETTLLNPRGGAGTSKPRPVAKPNPKAIVAVSESESSGSDESSGDDDDEKGPVE